MDTVDFPRFLFAFCLVLGLIALMAYVLKRYAQSQTQAGSQKIFGMKNDSGRIKIVEMRYLDSKRRLVLVRRDEVEHLLLLADNRELVVESGIRPPMMDAHE